MVRGAQQFVAFFHFNLFEDDPINDSLFSLFIFQVNVAETSVEDQVQVTHGACSASHFIYFDLECV